VTKPILLDLYCGCGGASVGYARAGFDVVGMDINPQPNYPYEFHQCDALEFLSYELPEFDVIHASPPCQASSTLKALWPDRDYPELIPATRKLLEDTEKPYVIENVPGASLLDPVTLCGSMFGLGANGRYLRRHRNFESNLQLVVCLEHDHTGQAVGVYGHGGGGEGKSKRGYKGSKEEYEEAMGINWATKKEIAQAIPPSYSEYIGEQLMEAL
jgi:DNA (cytosine-5)-methyltransferase 1